MQEKKELKGREKGLAGVLKIKNRRRKFERGKEELGKR